MPHKSDVHVTQQGERDKWAVNEEGSQQASCTHRTQSAAIDSGRAQAKRNRAELLVHGRRQDQTEGNVRAGPAPLERASSSEQAERVFSSRPACSPTRAARLLRRT